MATLVSSSTTFFICKTPKLLNLAIHSKASVNKFKKINFNLYTTPYSLCTDDNKFQFFKLSSSSCKLFLSTKISAITSTNTPISSSAINSSTHQHYWIVVMDAPPESVNSRPKIIDFYVKTMQSVLGSQKDAEMCIYDASCETHFGFCCHVDEEIAREIARLPGVLSVRPDPDYNIVRKDCSYYKVPSNTPSTSFDGNTRLFPLNNTKHWLVHVEKPTDEAIAKPQVVDYYVQILMKILGNEKDAQMCIYNGSWETNFGFCCELDDACAQELAGVPGVISVQPDEDMSSDNIGYRGGDPLRSSKSPESIVADQTPNIGTKKLFVTGSTNFPMEPEIDSVRSDAITCRILGLSFYTSEKTLRAAFEGFGELVEVRIIMDKISKRSRGYAFIEYTTEAAASAALKEMNGKIINGWMIVVDVAKKNPTNYNRQRKTGFMR